MLAKNANKITKQIQFSKEVINSIEEVNDILDKIDFATSIGKYDIKLDPKYYFCQWVDLNKLTILYLERLGYEVKLIYVQSEYLIEDYYIVSWDVKKSLLNKVIKFIFSLHP